MPSLVVKISKPRMKLWRDAKETSLSIQWVGVPQVPDDWSKSGTFIVRDGDRVKADGWHLPVSVMLKRASDQSAADVNHSTDTIVARATSRSGVRTVGSMRLGWLEGGGEAGEAPAYIAVSLEAPPSEFDSIAASVTGGDNDQLAVFTPFWMPERNPDETHEHRMLRTGLTHGHHPDGKDMVWDSSYSAETEIETFSLAISRSTSIEAAQNSAETISAIGDQIDTSRATTISHLARLRSAIVRVFWAIVLFGVLGALALLT